MIVCTYCKAKQLADQVAPRFQVDEWHERCPYDKRPHCPQCHALFVERHVLGPDHPHAPASPHTLLEDV